MGKKIKKKAKNIAYFLLSRAIGKISIEISQSRFLKFSEARTKKARWCWIYYYFGAWALKWFDVVMKKQKRRWGEVSRANGILFASKPWRYSIFQGGLLSELGTVRGVSLVSLIHLGCENLKAWGLPCVQLNRSNFSLSVWARKLPKIGCFWILSGIDNVRTRGVGVIRWLGWIQFFLSFFFFY